MRIVPGGKVRGLREDREVECGKVLVLVPVPVDRDGLARRQAQLAEVDLGCGAEFEFRAVKFGPAYFDSHHDLMLAEIALTDAGAGAQAEGFDAVCVDTMSDSAVKVLRSLLDIPVIGPARSRSSPLSCWGPVLRPHAMETMGVRV